MQGIELVKYSQFKMKIRENCKIFSPGKIKFPELV